MPGGYGKSSLRRLRSIWTPSSNSNDCPLRTLSLPRAARRHPYPRRRGVDRRRSIAAAPFRSSAQAWTVIEELVINTLTASPKIPAQEVRTALQSAAQVGRHLIAG